LIRKPAALERTAGFLHKNVVLGYEAGPDQRFLALVNDRDLVHCYIRNTLILVPQIENTVFNIVQESINNAKKHARARNIWVSLRRISNKLIIVIQDDGQGFDVSLQQDQATKRGSYGLLNMRERAAAVNGDIGITSVRGRGTTITLTVPLLAA